MRFVKIFTAAICSLSAGICIYVGGDAISRKMYEDAVFALSIGPILLAYAVFLVVHACRSEVKP